MVDTYNKFKSQGLEFVAVAMSYDPPNYVLNYAGNAQAAVPGRARHRRLGRQGLRQRRHDADTFVIGKDGKVPQALRRRAGLPGAAQAAGRIAARLKSRLRGQV
jgi:hypothetical protein